jgi:hypothetical protein
LQALTEIILITLVVGYLCEESRIDVVGEDILGEQNVEVARD